MRARSDSTIPTRFSPEAQAAITAEIWLDAHLQSEMQKNPEAALKGVLARLGIKEDAAISFEDIAASPVPPLSLTPNYDDKRPPFSSTWCGTYDMTCGAGCTMDCQSAYCGSVNCVQSFDTACPSSTYCSTNGCTV